MIPNRLPPLNSLRAFEVAARLGSFAAAADELSLTSAAISHRIKSLEDRLGVALFDRQPRGVTLTDAGRRYYERLSDIFTQIEQATLALNDQSIDGPLTVSAPHSFLQHWLLPRLVSLRARHPGLLLVLRGESQLMNFRDHQADVGIRFGTGRYPNLYVEPLMTDRISILGATERLNALSDTHPISLLRAQPLLEDSSVHASEPWNTWQPWFQALGIRRTSNDSPLQFSDSSLVLAACVEGLGLCLGRYSIASHLLAARKLQAIAPWRSHEYAYYLVSHPSEAENPRALAFKNWLQDEVMNFMEVSPI
ncbi:LysR substrate-binding domain-containing protein [Salinispirillum marinum]|uniref:LysR substrate-binding domain-containing protein n=2 Tax=Saccharospirillaceae TaxID=255527 RepID=A0ABV8BA84_9GAMM